MKPLIQISVFILAALVGIAWEKYHPQVYDTLGLSGQDIMEEESSAVELAQTESQPGKQETNPALPGSASSASNQPATTSPTDPAKKNPPAEKTPKQETPETKAPPKETVASTTKITKTTSTKSEKAESSPAPPAATDKPMPSDADLMKNQEENIERIVTERYPDLAQVPFAEKFADLTTYPVSAYPEQIKTNRELNFKVNIDGKLVGIGLIKAGGQVKPISIDDDKITIASLADNEMREILPLAETDFLPQAEARYQASLDRAIQRIQEMRERDSEEIRKNLPLYKKLMTEGKVWHGSDDPQFDEVKESLQQQVGTSFEPVAFYNNGYLLLEDGSKYSGGGYIIVLVLLKGKDDGFGPYYWQARCLIQSGQIAGWQGIPQIRRRPNS